MATRSFIGKLNKDDSITGIYCHFDGYPEHAGRILIDNYLTEQQVDQDRKSTRLNSSHT